MKTICKYLFFCLILLFFWGCVRIKFETNLELKAFTSEIKNEKIKDKNTTAILVFPVFVYSSVEKDTEYSKEYYNAFIKFNYGYKKLKIQKNSVQVYFNEISSEEKPFVKIISDNYSFVNTENMIEWIESQNIITYGYVSNNLRFIFYLPKGSIIERFDLQ